MDTPTGRRCPSCGNRVADESTKRLPDEELCTPVTCPAWDTVAVYDHAEHRWVPVYREPRGS